MLEFKLERSALVSSEQKREREAHKKLKTHVFFEIKKYHQNSTVEVSEVRFLRFLKIE